MSKSPPLIVGHAALALAFLTLPLLAMMVLAPWADLPRLLGQDHVLHALRLSILTATTATVLCLLGGVPLAWMLHQHTGRAVQIVRALVTVPLVLPPVVGGVALLLAYGRSGLVGRPLFDVWGVQIPFSTLAVVVAQTFVALPFTVVTVEGALRGLGPQLAEAAATLGATPGHIFRTITVPLIAPSLVAAGVLSWARALGEFGATVTFAGNLPGVTQTMPSAVYRAFETDPPSAVALSVVLMGLSVAVLVGVRDRWTHGRSPW